MGEQNVVQAMKDNSAVIGGEENGGVIDGRRHYGRDSLSATYHILNLMNITGKTLDQLVDELPNLIIIKDKLTINDHYDEKAIVEVFPETTSIDQSDGIRIDFDDLSWV